MGEAIRLRVEGWDGAPFHLDLVALAAEERGAVNAARRLLAREGAVLVGWDAGAGGPIDPSALGERGRIDPPSPEGVVWIGDRVWTAGRFRKQGVRAIARLDHDPAQALLVARRLCDALRAQGLVPVLLHDRAGLACRLLGRCWGQFRAGTTRACPAGDEGGAARATALLAQDLAAQRDDWCLLAGGALLVDELRALGAGALEVRGVLRSVERRILLYAEAGDRCIVFHGDRTGQALLRAALPAARLAEWQDG